MHAQLVFLPYDSKIILEFSNTVLTETAPVSYQP